MSELEQLLAIIEGINQLMRREREDCPFCGQKVEALEQVSVSVYPCGHRLGRGMVPLV
jgi:hypothetical protein